MVKVEPAPGGDNTRRLPGSGSGYFGTYKRNKRSISVNLKSVEGLEFATRLVRESDVLIENFGVGVLDRLGLGYKLRSCSRTLGYFTPVRESGSKWDNSEERSQASV